MFDVYQIQQASVIKRWAIIDMARDQSVAEHTFNVAMIAIELSRETGVWLDSVAMVAILCHDMPETRTGDIPTPVKRWGGGIIGGHLLAYEEDTFPLLRGVSDRLTPDQRTILEAADTLEAIAYCKRYGVDPRAPEVITGLEESLRKILSQLPGLGGAISKISGKYCEINLDEEHTNEI